MSQFITNEAIRKWWRGLLFSFFFVCVFTCCFLVACKYTAYIYTLIFVSRTGKMRWKRIFLDYLYLNKEDYNILYKYIYKFIIFYYLNLNKIKNSVKQYEKEYKLQPAASLFITMSPFFFQSEIIHKKCLLEFID
jgi:hypothetical protein